MLGEELVLDYRLFESAGRRREELLEEVRVARSGKPGMEGAGISIRGVLRSLTAVPGRVRRVAEPLPVEERVCCEVGC